MEESREMEMDLKQKSVDRSFKSKGHFDVIIFSLIMHLMFWKMILLFYQHKWIENKKQNIGNLYFLLRK